MRMEQNNLYADFIACNIDWESCHSLHAAAEPSGVLNEETRVLLQADA